VVKGLRRLQRQLTKEIPMRVRRAARAAMESAASDIVAEMRRRAPKSTGALAASIGWTWGAAPAGSISIGSVGGTSYKRMRITIFAGNSDTMVENQSGFQFQNAVLQEFGTMDMPPSPYFYVTWREKRRSVRSRITRQINNAIRAV